jgi:predicted secreted protein
VQQINHEYIVADTDRPGDSGHEIWIFRANGKGTAIISTEYSQPWEGGRKKEWTFFATMTVE